MDSIILYNSHSIIHLLKEREEGRISLAHKQQTKHQNERIISICNHHRERWKSKMILAGHHQMTTNIEKDSLHNDDSHQMNHNNPFKNPNPFLDHNWRSYCHRRIPFTELGTPTNDALLAIDMSGSYMICLGGIFYR